MSDFKNYDPDQVVVSFAGIIITGFAPGTLVTVERNTDSFSLSQGAKGDGTRVRSRDRSGRCVINTMAEAPVNDLLSARLTLDELTGLGYGALLVRNLNGTTLAAAANAWLIKPANIEYASDPSPREWTIEAHELKMLVGGALI